ncbi:oxidoreductase [Nonomuraea gerenzanensis]|uniref:Dehydrogenases with different specificities (Related to short-chain alcohol dehydrogenases) n=1 Tax=Nonomuraea gerenzanensis TaxID=93944 RepID=A0A1M4E1F3_9ACTN|nr:oxidoreductase [Nonomuraea gerenzanensis]UBU14890.1 SDR family NAD(P)-dependent oxidoreductase [Nonomuraea gerenzanensis]SBO92625.1 Dehydrogenases with different specificities (related to short-chain alcohol dehydrogenases) [Nonomuraea gerenzanensis]
MNPRTWLITGASSGLGRALAEYVLDRGDQAVVTASSTRATTELAARHPSTALALPLDVTDPQQRAAGVKQAEERFGGIDVLVNNAGIDFIGALEEQEESDYRRLFEVNFFGAVALTRLVLPGMRARRRGIVVNVSSMDGLASLPANGYYSASKFALEGFTEALWQEIEPLGLHAMIVQPGSFRTGIEHRTKASGAPIDDYSATAGAFRAMMGTLTPEMFPGDPVRAAAAMYDAVTAGRPRHWLVLGSDAHRRIDAKLRLLRAEFDAGERVAVGTDFPGSAEHAVL